MYKFFIALRNSIQCVLVTVRKFVEKKIGSVVKLWAAMLLIYYTNIKMSYRALIGQI
jgi:hypothetical protein